MGILLASIDIPILKEIVIIFGLSVLIILAFQKLKVPAIIGFLITGIVAGPHGLGIIHSGEDIEILAEIGVIFLLFVIGIEFSLKSLIAIKRTVFLGGLMQVGITIGITALVTLGLGKQWNEAVFVGFLFALSSTAIVLKMLQERGETNSPHGRIAVAILIFQDLIVVPMMLVAPLMAGNAENVWVDLGIMGLKVALVLALVILFARYVVPRILDAVVKTRSRELFILTVVVLCFATAWLTSVADLSLALGAFFAGLVVSESEYSHQATANILPFREIFISFFFVSVGMLLDVDFFISHFTRIHLLAILVAVGKFSIVFIAAKVLRYPTRTVIISGLYLFQVGEFAFVLSLVGIQAGLLSGLIYQYFLAVSIITMGATPFIINWAPGIADRLLKTPVPKPVRSTLQDMTRNKAETMVEEKDFEDHLVIIGYGLNGQNVARAAREADIQYEIVELDPERIAEAKRNKEPVVFGDASEELILQHVNAHKARVVVIAISDPHSTKLIVSRIRELTETAYIIVRTRSVREIEENVRLGADEVIPEEFETSIEIFTRVLRKYLVPTSDIQKFITRIRSHNYETLRMGPSPEELGLHINSTMHIPDMEIATIRVAQEKNAVVGKRIGDSDLRTKYNVHVLAIKRNDDYITDVGSDEVIRYQDVLYLFGPPEQILEMNRYLRL